MITMKDWEGHPLWPLSTKSFDNHDAAFALEIPSFTDWRKSWERAQLSTLPRYDANPVRPTYRLGHIYEYALLKEIAKTRPKHVAAYVVREQFRAMSNRAKGLIGRFGGLERDLQEVVSSNKTQNELDGAEAASYHKWDAFGYLVDFPLLGFDPEILDRSSERNAKPIFWLIPPDIDEDSEGFTHGRSLTLTGEYSLADALKLLSEFRRQFDGSPELPTFLSAQAINVTEILSNIDRKLTIRLSGRRIKGGDE